jgi:hypothetical protein
MSQRKAFVLMPFKEPFNSYYPAIYRPALEDAGFDVTRADDLFTPQPVMLDIQNSILNAEVILCDMSDRNPNVFYELGLAHAIGKPVVLISRKKDDIPFDLRHIRVILYDYTVAGWEATLRKAVTSATKAALGVQDIWPPPLIPTGPATDSTELAGGDEPVELFYQYGARDLQACKTDSMKTTWSHVFNATAPNMVNPSQMWSVMAELRSEVMFALRKRGIDPGSEFECKFTEKTRNEIKVQFMALGLIKVDVTQHDHEVWQLTQKGTACLMQSAKRKDSQSSNE